MAIWGVVGVLGREGMAALAMALAGLGMAGGHAAGLRASCPVGRDQPTHDPLRLTAPDAVLLAGPHREGQASRTGQAVQMPMASRWPASLSAKNGS